MEVKQTIMLMMIILSVLFENTKSSCIPCGWFKRTKHTTPKRPLISPIAIHCKPASPRPLTPLSEKQSSLQKEDSDVFETMSRPDPICRYSKHQITTHCARMISAFPVQFSAKQKPEFWKLHDLVGADEITEFLITLCTQRFDELNNSTTGHQKHSRSADAKLIIVDLDAIGTVLPKALSGEIDADEIRTHNQEQLRCNVLSKHKVIYKKGFMDFIEMVHGWKDVYHLASFT
eukprot:465995_1